MPDDSLIIPALSSWPKQSPIDKVSLHSVLLMMRVYKGRTQHQSKRFQFWGRPAKMKSDWQAFKLHTQKGRRILKHKKLML
jgi:hypothetical protein